MDHDTSFDATGYEESIRTVCHSCDCIQPPTKVTLTCIRSVAVMQYPNQQQHHRLRPVHVPHRFRPVHLPHWLRPVHLPLRLRPVHLPLRLRPVDLPHVNLPMFVTSVVKVSEANLGCSCT